MQAGGNDHAVQSTERGQCRGDRGGRRFRVCEVVVAGRPTPGSMLTGDLCSGRDVDVRDVDVVAGGPQGTDCGLADASCTARDEHGGHG